MRALYQEIAELQQEEREEAKARYEKALGVVRKFLPDLLELAPAKLDACEAPTARQSGCNSCDRCLLRALLKSYEEPWPHDTVLTLRVTDADVSVTVEER